MNTFNFSKWNKIIGWTAFAIALITYTLTVEPTMSFWDCGEYISTAANLEVGHPPGAPLFQMIGAFFAMFAIDKTQIAFMVNMMSVISSAFTILFMFWSLTKILKKIANEVTTVDDKQGKIIIGASFIAALSYTFTDSFWFNAVEAEVYAMGSLFIAALVWLGLKWEEEMDEPRGNKWLVLISLVIGLCFGVHFLSILALPSIGLMYYFKKTEKITLKNFIIANITIVAILMFIFKLMLPYTLAFIGKTEIFMVNNLHLPFNLGTIFAFLFIIATFVFTLKLTKKKGYVMANTLTLCLLFILVGFSSWLMLPVRANSNININENKPSDAAEVLAYYNREQYGEQKLFWGPHYTVAYAKLDKDKPYKDEKPNYERNYKTGKYEVVNNYINASYNYDEAHNGLLPRMWSEEHIKNYMRYTNPPEFSVNKEAFYDEETEEYDEETYNQFLEIVSNFKNEKEKSPADYDKFFREYGDALNIETPTQIDNFKFMFEYQFGYMYFRYLMWNFVGRQNDLQGESDYLEGNWLSGITFIDEIFLDKQDKLTTDMKENKARNTYFFLPFILAIIGMVYHASKEWKSFYVLLVLFLFTGLILKIYLNERPYEPRERDYALVGSFYVFAMWIGIGVYAIYNTISEYMAPKNALILTLSVSMLCSPILLASQNWDDHDRSDKYTAVAMAKAYLDSCDKNAILFTIGDNDTFPLWYLQEIEGYRTDVRIVNTSLLAMDWYIDEMKIKSNESDPLPISFTHNQIVGDKRDYCLNEEITKDTITLDFLMKFIKDKRSEREMQSGQKVHFYPNSALKINVNKSDVIKNKVVLPKYNDSIVSEININIGNALYKNRMIMLDIVNTNKWKRPIYFSPGSYDDSDYIWMKEYLQLDGMVYRLVPVRTKMGDSKYDFGYIDSDIMLKNVRKWEWGNSGSDKIYHDPETRKNSISSRGNMSRLMNQLIKEKRFKEAEEIIEIAMKNMPIKYFDHYTTVEPFAEGYYKLGKKEKARAIISELIVKYREKLEYFRSTSLSYRKFYEEEIMKNIYFYKSLVETANYNDDMEYYEKEIDRFEKLNNLMGPFKYKDEPEEIEDLVKEEIRDTTKDTFK